MRFTAEVTGKSADRFRAYAAAKLLRSPVAADHIKRAETKLPPLEAGTKIRYDGEEVELDGDVVGETVKFTTKPGVTITKVVFYKGDVEAEAVVGSAEVNASGEIEVELVDPPAPEAAAALIVDE